MQDNLDMRFSGGAAAAVAAAAVAGPAARNVPSQADDRLSIAFLHAQTHTHLQHSKVMHGICPYHTRLVGRAAAAA